MDYKAKENTGSNFAEAKTALASYEECMICNIYIVQSNFSYQLQMQLHQLQMQPQQLHLQPKQLQMQPQQLHLQPQQLQMQPQQLQMQLQQLQKQFLSRKPAHCVLRSPLCIQWWILQGHYQYRKGLQQAVIQRLLHISTEDATIATCVHTEYTLSSSIHGGEVRLSWLQLCWVGAWLRQTVIALSARACTPCILDQLQKHSIQEGLS